MYRFTRFSEPRFEFLRRFDRTKNFLLIFPLRFSAYVLLFLYVIFFSLIPRIVLARFAANSFDVNVFFEIGVTKSLFLLYCTLACIGGLLLPEWFFALSNVGLNIVIQAIFIFLFGLQCHCLFFYELLFSKAAYGYRLDLYFYDSMETFFHSSTKLVGETSMNMFYRPMYLMTAVLGWHIALVVNSCYGDIYLPDNEERRETDTPQIEMDVPKDLQKMLKKEVKKQLKRK